MSLILGWWKKTISQFLFRQLFGVWPEESELVQKVVDSRMAELAWGLWKARIDERRVSRKYFGELPVKVNTSDLREQRRRQRQVASCKDRLLNAQHYAEFFGFAVKDPADYVLNDIEDLAGEVVTRNKAARRAA